MAGGDRNSFNLGESFTSIGSGVRLCGETFSGIAFSQRVDKGLAGSAVTDLGGPGVGATLLSSNPCSATC